MSSRLCLLFVSLSKAASPIRPKRTALSRNSHQHPAINTLMQKHSTKGRLAGSLAHKAMSQLNINPWGRRWSNKDDESIPAPSPPDVDDYVRRLPVRVIIHPYHPQSKEACSPTVFAKLVNLPRSLEELLELAGM